MTIMVDKEHHQPQQTHQQEMPSSSSIFTDPLSSSSCSSSSPQTHTQTHTEQQPKSQTKLPNTGTLLDQYQDDDDLTTNLLHAIRSWNLERPPPSPRLAHHHALGTATATSAPSNHKQQPNQNSHHHHHHLDCNSTINSDTDTFTLATMGSSSSITNANSITPFAAASGINHYHSDGDNGSTTTTNDENQSHPSHTTNGTTPTTNTNTSQSSGSLLKRGLASSSTGATTPCKGNYSSRPSGLTARILLESNNLSSSLNAVVADVNVDKGNDKQGQNNQANGDISIIHNSSCDDDKNDRYRDENDGGMALHTTHKLQQSNEHLIHLAADASCNLYNSQCSKTDVDPTDQPIQSQQQPQPQPQLQTQTQTQTQTHIDSMKLLQDISSTLGLDPTNDLEIILPTIQKLVRVVMVHVPNLEQFVDQVCEIVENKSAVSADAAITATTEDNCDARGGEEQFSKEGEVLATTNTVNKASSRSRQKQQQRQPQRKSLHGRKKRMDDAVQVLKREFQAKVIPSTFITPNKSRKVLPNAANVNNIGSSSSDSSSENVNCDLQTKAKSVQGSTTIKAASQESLFRDAVIGKLENCDFDYIGTQQHFDEEQALAVIDDLIAFEQKYRKVKGVPSGDSNSNFSAVQSPPQSKTILRDLFNADPSTLKHIVLHLAYLYSVRPAEIMEKMNNVYIFSNEASAMIDNIRKAMDLSPDCPVNAVEKRVMGMIQAKEFAAKMPSVSAENYQQRNVRFNTLVEEFSL